MADIRELEDRVKIELDEVNRAISCPSSFFPRIIAVLWRIINFLFFLGPIFDPPFFYSFYDWFLGFFFYSTNFLCFFLFRIEFSIILFIAISPFIHQISPWGILLDRRMARVDDGGYSGDRRADEKRIGRSEFGLLSNRQGPYDIATTCNE